MIISRKLVSGKRLGAHIVAGTWWVNRYPGVRCDVPNALYSFSFAPNYTSPDLYTSGRDFVRYLSSVAAQNDVIDRIQCNTEVTSVRWLNDDQEWEIHVAHLTRGAGDLSVRERNQRIEELGQDSVILSHETLRAKVVISCVGILVEPRTWPDDVPGVGDFEGTIIHSARWRADIDLTGKVVLLVGGGCSAAQIVPSLLSGQQGLVKSMTQVIRDPPWVLPRLPEMGGKEAYAKYAPLVYGTFPFLGHVIRLLGYLMTEIDWYTAFQHRHKKTRAKLEQFALKHMHNLAPEKYHDALTPRYMYGCKRRVFDEDWLRSMSNVNFKLVTQRLEKLNARSATFASEKGQSSSVELHADVIILANGFEATRWLHPLEVIGRHGSCLQEIWDGRGGPQAYLGTAVDGFPNFFLVSGPNTFVARTSALLASESTVNYIMRIMKPVLKGDATLVEPTRQAVLQWTSNVQQKLKDTVFSSCASWYQDEKGWNSVLYPRSQIDFAFRCRFPRYHDWNVALTRKGKIKRRSKTIAWSTVVVAGFWLTGMKVQIEEDLLLN
ncbi:MAG: hypothetical protein M1820_010788 [Bogoriella megaspora]|nr:MAG: hypothetical protein M1820_010788 [Bogoriella megaspora]